ncbi:MAG: winged helix-turn-helix transcriptional regulator [Treponema sp.]|nr:winged helix-turn-helix transcriptional regulator [Treponema sp.]
MGKRIDNTPCHCLKIRRSAENVIRFYDSVLAPSGVTVRQYSLLYQISEHDKCNVRNLAELTELDRSTLARSLKPLMNAGLVNDVKEPGTRDSKLSLSEKGFMVCKEAEDLWNEAQRMYEEKVGRQQVAILENALEALQAL